jgi:HNH endonuclease
MREITYQITGDCWHCTSHKPNTDGYPVTKIAGKNCRIGRLFFERFKGEIPDGKIVRHTCDNRMCINPDHLILGTHADNMRDMAERGRAPFGGNHHNAKISERQVMEIRGNTSDSMMTLAKRYGVSKSHIWNIKHGVKWRRVGVVVL